MKKVNLKSMITFLLAIAFISFLFPKNSMAHFDFPCRICCTQCADDAVKISKKDADISKKYVTDEFIYHRKWLVEEVFNNHLLPALMLFAEQMTASAMNQVVGVGMLLDAKHQLETQRLFQQMTAEAHKSYQPSEGMCTFGTIARSLAASDRNMDLSAAVISARSIQRELLSGDTLTGGGASTDFLSRAKQFQSVYCNPADNGNGLSKYCASGSVDPSRTNNDINYTKVMDSPLTLQMDFTAQGEPDHKGNAHSNNVSKDEEDIFALSSNLYANKVVPTIPPSFLTDVDDGDKAQGIFHYMNIRALSAKRSVARNSFSSIAAMKSQGAPEVEAYLYAIMKEFGLQDDEITAYLGDRPSYYAQMEILTRKLYQNPIFYTELYDKPANVSRKMVSMQAIELMQRRDIYRSMLRSEAILSVMLETALGPKQDAISNEIPLLKGGDLISLGN